MMIGAVSGGSSALGSPLGEVPQHHPAYVCCSDWLLFIGTMTLVPQFMQAACSRCVLMLYAVAPAAATAAAMTELSLRCSRC